MKLLRYGPKGAEKPGILDAEGNVRDLTGPIGPWFVTADEVSDPQNLRVTLDLNGRTAQESNTDDMIFSVGQIVSYMSQFMELQPGDIIATGTPSGVGMGMKPPRFLRPGNVMEIEVQGLGRQRQTAVAAG